MTRKIYYSSDVSIEDHANLVVFLQDGTKNGIFIERDDNVENYLIYSVELFDKPSDSWLSESDLKDVNGSCDSDYEFNKELSEHDQYLFTSDLCWYYGANNFDSYPNQFISHGSFIEWLETMELI